jgi:hypothetical protein
LIFVVECHNLSSCIQIELQLFLSKHNPLGRHILGTDSSLDIVL